MVLVETVHLNNRGIALWTSTIEMQLDKVELRIYKEEHENNILRCFAGSLVAARGAINELSSNMQDPTTALGASPETRTLCFLAHPIRSFQGVRSSRRRLFVFHTAFEAGFVQGMKEKNVAPSMEDTVACSACAIFNLSLVHHLKYLRGGRDEDGVKVEELYRLALEALEASSPANLVPKINIWIHLGALNNLGTVKTSRGDLEGAHFCFSELMGLLNVLEIQMKTPGNHNLQPLLDETEWTGMTNNCRKILQKSLEVAMTA
jgi:hypothetical protein